MSELRVIYITDDGVPKTGLTPVFTYFHDGTSNVTLPTVVERGNGFYTFTVSSANGKVYTGIIDAGSALTNNNERYIPVVFQLGDTSIIQNISTNVTPSYIATSDTAVFLACMFRDGVIAEDIDSVSITVYDSAHTSMFTVSSNTISDNGMFTVTKSTPGFVAGGVYYAVATFTIGAATYKTNETIIAIN